MSDEAPEAKMLARWTLQEAVPDDRTLALLNNLYRQVGENTIQINYLGAELVAKESYPAERAETVLSAVRKARNKYVERIRSLFHDGRSRMDLCDDISAQVKEFQEETTRLFRAAGR